MILAFAYETSTGAKVASDLVEEKEGKYFHTESGEELKQIVAKMSKSLNNFFTIREVLAIYDAETTRYFLTSGQYRSQLNYSTDNLDQARASLERIYTALRDVTVPNNFVL